jgi:hypothetical protein
MKYPLATSLLAALLAATAAGCGQQQSETGSQAELPPPRELEWDDLMPADYDPSTVLPELGDEVSDLTDDDPQAQRYLQMVRDAWDQAPVVPSLDGQRVRLPGFVVPVDYDDKNVAEFLLVPYFGACIHTPPPPANQIVHVTTGGFGPSPDQLWDPVWVTGIMATEHVSSELAEAGYRMQAESIEPYDIDGTQPQ